MVFIIRRRDMHLRPWFYEALYIFDTLNFYQASYPFFKSLTGLLLKYVVLLGAIQLTLVVLFSQTKVFLLADRTNYRRHPC